MSHPHHELYRLLRKQTKPRGGSKATMPGMCFWWKSYSCFSPTVMFKPLSNKDRCWLEQTNNVLYVILVHSSSHWTSNFLLMPSHSINYLPARRGCSRSSLSSFCCDKISWALLITKSTGSWQLTSYQLRPGSTSSTWKPEKPPEYSQLFCVPL